MSTGRSRSPSPEKKPNEKEYLVLEPIPAGERVLLGISPTTTGKNGLQSPERLAQLIEKLVALPQSCILFADSLQKELKYDPQAIKGMKDEFLRLNKEALKEFNVKVKEAKTEKKDEAKTEKKDEAKTEKKDDHTLYFYEEILSENSEAVSRMAVLVEQEYKESKEFRDSLILTFREIYARRIKDPILVNELKQLPLETDYREFVTQCFKFKHAKSLKESARIKFDDLSLEQLQAQYKTQIGDEYSKFMNSLTYSINYQKTEYQLILALPEMGFQRLVYPTESPSLHYVLNKGFSSIPLSRRVKLRTYSYSVTPEPHLDLAMAAEAVVPMTSERKDELKETASSDSSTASLAIPPKTIVTSSSEEKKESKETVVPPVLPTSVTRTTVSDDPAQRVLIELSTYRHTMSKMPPELLWLFTLEAAYKTNSADLKIKDLVEGMYRAPVPPGDYASMGCAFFSSTHSNPPARLSLTPTTK